MTPGKLCGSVVCPIFDKVQPAILEAVGGEAYSTSTTKELCRCVFFLSSDFSHDWEQKFVDQARIYYKNGYMKDLDDRFGDLYGTVADREVEIMHDLEVQILYHRTALEQASEPLISKEVVIRSSS
ncbi:unnamed protein product [Parascedosporium putredinis]|uniref:Uncharacterized protein n=1 Tax=Parascedosporium putredinis TaxID=1442378 RepID=A0A9P1H1G2_9PEZI|nr:unnamed protein product [Parascedosporium putredinis]CAI7992744.1 unnamed protein product [Parascedosporium putredinis]